MDNVKSGKREVGGAILVLWAAITVKVFFFSDAALVEAYSAIYGAFSLAALPVGLFPFGLHAVLHRKRGVE